MLRAGYDFEFLINRIRIFLRALTNVSADQVPVTVGGVGGGEYTITTIRGYLMPILPELFALIGIILAIVVALKLFKRFSR